MPPLIALHALLAAMALVIGLAVLLRQKGTRSHKFLGRLWVAAMVGVAVCSFWIFEIRRGAGPSWIHILSVWTLVSLALAVWFIRRGNVRAHKAFMVGTFLGLAGAGLGAMAPGRALSRLLFGGGSGLF
jgi:uncharacterized membrane protein